MSYSEYNDYGRNSFKTIFKGGNQPTGQTNPTIPKIMTADVSKEEEFPTLGTKKNGKKNGTKNETKESAAIGSSGSVSASVDYKKAIETSVVEEDASMIEEVVPPGWVKYTFNKKTQKIEEKKGEKIAKEEGEDVLGQDLEDEESHRALLYILQKNREMHRKSFIECHGEEHYKNQYYTPNNYVETDSCSSETSDYDQ